MIATAPSPPALQSSPTPPGFRILPLWISALAAPFTNLTWLVRFGAAPFLAALLTLQLENLIQSAGILRFALFWRFLIMVIVYVPFEVGWLRLVIDGPDAVAGRGYFSFGLREAQYLIASAIFMLSWAAVLLPALLFQYAYRNFDPHLTGETAVMLAAILLGLLIVEVRLLFVFCALASDRYQGLARSWRQTRGCFEQLLVLDVLAHAPFLLAADLLDRTLAPGASFVARLAVATLEGVLLMLSAAAGWAAIALAYRALALGRDTA